MENNKIKKFHIWEIFAYFIFYSFLGYVIETIFGIATMGIWESRQSFLYGPFCGIYGMAAVIIIFFSQYFDKNIATLFFGGCIIGSIVEYLISFLTEAILYTHWWDYSLYIFNINGRVCLLYSIFWGILTIALVKVVNPLVDKVISKIELKRVLSCIILFLAVDCLITIYAQEVFITRMVVENNIYVKNFEARKQSYEQIQSNEKLKHFVDKYFSNEILIKTFPNLKIKDEGGNVIVLASLVPEVQTYIVKL